MTEEKRVDESWKQSAAEEKEKLEKTINVDESSGESTPQEPLSSSEKTEEMQKPDPNVPSSGESSENLEINFLNYIASLGFQTMIFLGEVTHPVTNKIEKNLPQAKFLIDTLLLLRDKTKGNLDKQEDGLLNGSIYELQMKYVEILKKDKEESS